MNYNDFKIGQKIAINDGTGVIESIGMTGEFYTIRYKYINKTLIASLNNAIHGFAISKTEDFPQVKELQ